MSVVPWDHLEFYGHGETDVNSWHFYTDDYEKARQHIQDVVKNTYAGSTHNYITGFQQEGQPLINSEYGGVGALDGDIDTSWTFKFLTNELRRHPSLSAYIYTELHDVEWERNGFLNYDRTPKEFGYDPTMVNQGDVLPMDAPPISRRVPHEKVSVAVFSSHFSRRKRLNVTLHWQLTGIDSLGWMHDDLVSGSGGIPFTHLRVEPAADITLQMPSQTMLCTLWVRAVVPDGTVVARNYVQFYVDGDAAARETDGARRVLRLEPHQWHVSDWNRAATSREEALTKGFCQGGSRGSFEWRFPFGSAELEQATRLTVLVEASAFREGAPQTDSFAHPTALKLLLNGIVVYAAVLPNHPHDARGALSYMRKGRGAYGYLCHAAVERDLLDEVKRAMKGNRIRLRCMVPREGSVHGGLTIYGSTTGRYPTPPTLIVE